MDEKTNKMYMGGDSAGVWEHISYTRKDPKVFKKDDMLFGYCGSFRMGQLIRYKFVIPPKDLAIDDYEYLCTTFMDDLMKCLRDNRYATLENNVLEGGTFLIGYNGVIYKVEDDFQVAIATESYQVCGCGEEFAWGALYTLESSKIASKLKIKKALEAAVKFSGWVKPPFNIISMPVYDE